MSHLRRILHILQQQQFYVNLKKSEFGQTIIGYLGHFISLKKSVYGSQKGGNNFRLACFQRKSNLCEGFCDWLGIIEDSYATMRRSCIPWLIYWKKGIFQWNTDSMVAFTNLKEVVPTALVLVMPDFDQTFSIECDVSRREIGIVLTQSKRPIAFFSKALPDSSLNKYVYEKELMVLVLSINH